MKRCIEMNLETLTKIRDLLCEVDPESYRHCHANFFDSSIGGHVRHILDFYERFFEATDGQPIDYAKRKRDTAVEQDPKAAVEMLDGIRSRIEFVTDGPVTVVSDSGESFDSSFGRELEFMAGHAVHHNAMIVAMSQIRGVTVSTEMAFAQSTLKYQKASA